MIKVEGRVDIEIDESSDSEPEDEPTPAAVPQQTIAVNFGNSVEDNEEEEVEYFGGKEKQPHQPEPKLASILVAQVKEAERTAATKPSMQPPAGDEFGITYQSKRRITSEGAPVAVVEGFDEDIAARLLNAAPANKPTEDDDEFDLDVDNDENQASNSETIRKALENAAAVAAAAEEASVSNLKDGTSTTGTSNTQETFTPVLNSNLGAGTTVASIMEEAKKALAEVAEVYGSGLGDHEVHLMSTSTTEPSAETRSAAGQTASLGCTGAIEEGDEEAAELEEELEEVRAVETVKAAAAATSQLESEWDNLNAAGPAGPGAGLVAELPVAAQQLTSAQQAPSGVVAGPAEKWKYTKALEFLKGLDHSAYKASIVVREESKGGWFSAAPKPISYAGSHTDLELPFLIAQIDYDPQAVQLFGMLSTIYSVLVDSAVGASQKWERLGFQGNDPRTDLNRSMKMLSIVQMLSYIEHDPVVAQRIFDLSQSANDPAGSAPQSIAERNARSAKDTSWPFMCVAIMFTKEALQCLRRGALNDKCNKHKTVFGVINQFHRACFAELENMLRAQPSVHHAVHLAALRKLCDSNPLKLMKKWKVVPAAGARTPQPAAPPADSDFRFDNLESVQEKNEEEEGSGSTWSNVFGDRKAAKFAAV